MLRFVVTADRVITPDPAATAPGRGLWLRATPEALHQGITRHDARRQLPRSASRSVPGPVTFPPDLPERLEAALVERLVTTLGLVKRAKLVAAGSTAIASAIAAGKARVLLIARDGVMAEHPRSLAAGLPIIDPLTICELSRVLDADETFVIAIGVNGLSERLSLDAARLMGLRQAIATGLAGTAVPGDHTTGAHG